jgi:hypothetical protein
VRPSDYQQQFSGPSVALVPGTIRGYREWTVQISMALSSLSAKTAWDSSTITAICWDPHAGGSTLAPAPGPGWHPVVMVDRAPPAVEGHDAPAPGCTCGIYACHSPFDDQTGRTPSVLRPGARIFGVIDAWGRVEMGARGFRAQHARIRAVAFTLPTKGIGGISVPSSARNDTFDLPNGKVCKGSELGKYWSDPVDWQMEFRRLYRDVMIFHDRHALLAQFPPIDVADLLPSHELQ